MIIKLTSQSIKKKGFLLFFPQMQVEYGVI